MSLVMPVSMFEYLTVIILIAFIIYYCCCSELLSPFLHSPGVRLDYVIVIFIIIIIRVTNIIIRNYCYSLPLFIFFLLLAAPTCVSIT